MIVSSTYAVGDTVVLSRALVDLVSRGMDVYYDGMFPDVFTGTGVRVSGIPSGEKRFQFRCNKIMGDINRSRLHYVAAAAAAVFEAAGVSGGISDLRPGIRLADSERATVLGRPHVVIAPGYKMDMPVKAWPASRWQAVVDGLRDRFEVVQIGAAGRNNVPVRLSGTLDLTGQTGIRDVFRLVAGAEACVSHVSMLAHVAAGFNVPCVVIAGGREPYWFEAYTSESWRASCGSPPPPDVNWHCYIDTIGKLGCCANGGCLRHRLGQGIGSCVAQVAGKTGVIPACMNVITANSDVLTAVGRVLDLKKGWNQRE